MREVAGVFSLIVGQPGCTLVKTRSKGNLPFLNEELVTPTGAAWNPAVAPT